MLKVLIHDYYAYAEWANARVLDRAAQLSEEQFLTSDLDHVWPVRDTLVHIMASQALWTDRWNLVSGSALWDPHEFPDVASIRDRWSEVNARTNAFLAAQTEETLAADLSYLGLDGAVFSYPLWQQMLHQANHATYHRGEVAALLSRYGASPGEIDVLRFVRARADG